MTSILSTPSSPRFWEAPPAARDSVFAELRARAPQWCPHPPNDPFLPDPGPDDGYWAIVRHADIREISHDPQRFVSSQGVFQASPPQEIVERTQALLAMDKPRHTAFRRLVAAAFTPRHVRALNASIERDAASIVDELEPEADGDFVRQIARRLPMLTVMRMLGVPPSEHDAMADLVQPLIAPTDPELHGSSSPLETVWKALLGFEHTAEQLIRERQSNPRDDLVSALVHAEVDGQRLTPREITSYFVLLTVAGNDTTRQTTSHAMLALSRNPDQRQWLLADLDGRIDSAIEEFIRWATPVTHFARRAVVDTEVGGHPIRAGEKVVMFYSSGNRDDEAFEHPERFDLGRDPNPHLGFGGGGPHYCMGAGLARTQLRALFTRLLRRYPDLHAGDPRYLVSNLINGITRLPMHSGRERR